MREENEVVMNFFIFILKNNIKIKHPESAYHIVQLLGQVTLPRSGAVMKLTALLDPALHLLQLPATV